VGCQFCAWAGPRGRWMSTRRSLASLLPHRPHRPSFPPFSLSTMAEDRPISSVNSEYITPRPSILALDGVVFDPAALDSATLEPPRASFFNPGPSIAESSPRDSRPVSTSGPEVDKESSTPALSTSLLPAGKDSEALPSEYPARSRPFYRRPVRLAIALGALVALILAIILPVYFTVIHKSNNSSSKISNNPDSGTTSSSAAAPTPSGSPDNPTNPNTPNTPSAATTGGDGSTVTSGNTSFVYSNPFGGYCEFLLTSSTYVHGRLTGAE